MTSRKETIPYEGRITADCHIHTEFSSDSETKITDQVERAIALGLDHICFTDHMARWHGARPSRVRAAPARCPCGVDRASPIARIVP